MMKAKINGVELEANTIEELKLLIEVVKTTPELKSQEPSTLDNVWESVCNGAECVYTTSTKDIVDGICSGFNSFIDWATTPSGK